MTDCLDFQVNTEENLAIAGRKHIIIASTLPNNNIRWYRGDTRTVTVIYGGGHVFDDRYVVHDNISTGQADLVIKNVTKNDEGIYTCRDETRRKVCTEVHVNLTVYEVEAGGSLPSASKIHLRTYLNDKKMPSNTEHNHTQHIGTYENVSSVITTDLPLLIHQQYYIDELRLYKIATFTLAAALCLVLVIVLFATVVHCRRRPTFDKLPERESVTSTSNIEKRNSEKDRGSSGLNMVLLTPLTYLGERMKALKHCYRYGPKSQIPDSV